MKLSHYGLETNKIENLGQAFAGQEVLLRTNQIIQYESGIFGYSIIPLRVMQKVESVIREVFDEFGLVEVLLPVMQNEALWRESGRWDGYVNDGTMLTVLAPKAAKAAHCLAPTAEEAVHFFAAKNIKSYKTLPVTYWQIGPKFRNELRNRGYMMRGKAFNMMDAYSFDKDEAGMGSSYENMRAAYTEVFKRLGLDVFAVAADSGAIGGDNSEEFMFVSPVGEDTIYIDKQTGKGYNIEVLEKYGIKDLSKYDEKRSVELGHIFQYGQKYSQPMNTTFQNASDKPEPFWGGCYGIGVSRVVAVIYDNAAIKDAKGNIVGISLPCHIAPYKVQIISSNEKTAEAAVLYKKLKKDGIACILDDRAHVTFGAKIQDVKKLGTPYMAILGDKVKSGEVEVEETATGTKTIMNTEELIKLLRGKICLS